MGTLLAYDGRVVLNIGLNWIFIYGNLGVPAMGLGGAGVATALARILVAVAMVAYVVLASGLKLKPSYELACAWSYDRDPAPPCNRTSLGRNASCGSERFCLRIIDDGVAGAWSSLQPIRSLLPALLPPS